MNPVKIKVAEKAFKAVFINEDFEFIGVVSDSGVYDQPMNADTKLGALNRLNFIKTKHPDADFYISQEGGLFDDGERLFNSAYIVVSDNLGFTAESFTPNFYLPKKITEYVKQGLELGDASDKFFNSSNSKQGVGAIWHITDGLMTREEYYLQAAIIALSEVKHKDWY